MRHRHNSSRISATCRFEWRPSYWLKAALLLLGVAAPTAIALSDAPIAVVVPGCIAAALWALRLLIIECKRQPVEVLMPQSELPVRIDDVAVEQVQVQNRGPLTVLSWRELGRWRCLLFWPDTLSREQRRELRLALDARRVSQLTSQVAP